MASERESLTQFLDLQRRGVLRIVEGLPEDSLRRPMVPSGWNCLGMVQHLTLNERYWFRWAMGGEEIPGTEVVDGHCRVVLEDMVDPDDEWLVAPQVRADTVLSRYRDEFAKADLAIAKVGLDAPPRQADDWWSVFGEGVITLRWVMLHMIEETAQHAGHLDIVRELLEDQTDAVG
jgi:hypothetical protein